MSTDLSPQVAMLSGYNGWVNGVAWDPLNKFICSIASDRQLRVYKTTKGFKMDSRASKCRLPLEGRERTVRLFHDDTFPSFYRRAAFSHDGEILAVPSGVLDVAAEEGLEVPKANGQNCTYLFSRRNFAK